MSKHWQPMRAERKKTILDASAFNSKGVCKLKTTELKRTILLGSACLLSALLVSTASFADDASPVDRDASVEVIIAGDEASGHDEAPSEIALESWSSDEGIPFVVDEQDFLLDEAFMSWGIADDETANQRGPEGEFTSDIAEAGAETGKSSNQMTQNECLRMFPNKESLCATFE